MTETEFGTNLFSNHKTIRLIMASTMLLAATARNRQHSSVLPLLRHYLPVFDKMCGLAMNFVFISSGANTPLGKPAALVLSVIN